MAKKKDKKGKKGKKDKKAEAEAGAEKGGKGKKGKKDKKGKKGKKGKGSVALPKEAEIKGKGFPIQEEPVPEPEPEKPVCNENLRPNDPCRYTEDPCCQSVVTCRPNKYPGLLEQPEKMAVVGSESGCYESLCKLVRAGLRCADRVFMMTPWGNYVIFRAHDEQNKIYFVYDGCTCNVNRFRYLDLREGTAGLLYFDCIHALIEYMIESRKNRTALRRIRKSVIDDICKEFCEFGYH